MYWARDEDDGRRNGQHSCRDTKKGTPRDESTKCAHTRYEIVRPPTIPQRVRGDFKNENSIARGRAVEKLDRTMREDENSIALGRADEKLDRAMREDENSIALRRAAEKLNRAMREDETPSHGASRRTVDRRDLLHSNRSEGRPTYSGWTDQRRDASGTPRSERRMKNEEGFHVKSDRLGLMQRLFPSACGLLCRQAAATKKWLLFGNFIFSDPYNNSQTCL